MSFLFPAMLAGLGALALPVILHLIARQRFPVMDFPTIRLLQGENRTNTLAPKLVDVWQLLLRLLVLALLILAMARLFAPWLSSAQATHNVVIVIDGSASMMQSVDRADGNGKISMFDLARQRASAILNEVNAPSRASVIIARGNATILAPLEPGHEHAVASLAGAKPFDACGCGVVEAVAGACDMLRGRREVSSQIIVLSNLRQSSFEYRSQRDLDRISETRSALGDSLSMVLVDLGSNSTENLGITDAYVRGRTVMAGADAHVISTITNTGTLEQPAKVTLTVGTRASTPKIIKIGPGSRAIVDLTSQADRAERTFAKVAIDGDSYPQDDVFSVPLPVVDSRRILIVNGSGQAGGLEAQAPAASLPGMNPGEKSAAHEPEIDGATILKFVLNPGRELGGTSNSGIDPVMVTPETVAVQPLSKYEIVILYDVSSLSEQVMNDLATFVSEGRSLVLVCSGKTSAVQFNRSLAVGSKDRAALAPAALESNEIESKTSLEISLRDNTHPIVTGFSDPRRGDLSVIHFERIRALRPDPLQEGTRVILQTPAQQPLILERTMGRGHVLMLTFGFELNRGNIARTRVFPPLMWRMVDYLTGRLKTLPPDQLIARTPAALDVSETNFSLTSDLELVREGTAAVPLTTQPALPGSPAAPVPAGERILLTASPDRTVMLEGLAPGRYLLQKARAPDEMGSRASYARAVTVQSDPRAGDMARVNPDDLPHLFGPQVRTVVGEIPANLVRSGGEFWKIFVIALIIAYAVEALAGFLATARREKERAPDKGVAS